MYLGLSDISVKYREFNKRLDDPSITKKTTLAPKFYAKSIHLYVKNKHLINFSFFPSANKSCLRYFNTMSWEWIMTDCISRCGRFQVSFAFSPSLTGRVYF